LAYPSKAVIDASLELLLELPSRWRNNPLVLAVLAATAALGCRTEQRAPGPDSRGEPGPSGKATSAAPGGSTAPTVPTAAQRDAAAKVAPIFQHGNGIASSGGVAATRIVFITEEDALRVITDEAAKAGIHFQPSARALDGVPLPVTSEFQSFAQREAGNAKPQSSLPISQPGSLKLDGEDAARKIAFEFVSKDDFATWQGKDTMGSTVSTYDVAGTARVLRQGLDQAVPAAGIYAVFYDPMPPFVPATKAPAPTSAADPKEQEAATLEKSRELIRMQVRDFIDWLKGQNAL